MTMLAVLFIYQTALAQHVFSPNVNGLKSRYQTRCAVLTRGEANQERGCFVVTCSWETSTAAVANEIRALGGEINALMGNQLVVDLPMSQLDAAAAIKGVLLIDTPRDGKRKTDTVRKASKVDEAHQGKAAGMEDLPQAYTGKGVIVGLIDKGFDFTHPMFKDAEGNLRIKGVYIAGKEKYRNEGESLDAIPDKDNYGNPTTVRLHGSFFTNPDIILDTMKVSDTDGSHGTHCASIAAGSIMDYTGTFKGKDEYSGKLGGMAPEAELFLANATVTDEQKKKYPTMKGYLETYNSLQALLGLMHFAQKQDKPLVVSWSMNDHEGFHDGTSTMARYIGEYCKLGNAMALCASNEGDDYMYIDRTIGQGQDLKVWVQGTNPSVNQTQLFIKTNKEIKVDLAVADKDCNIVYQCNLPLSSKATEEYKQFFETEVILDEYGSKKYDNSNDYYDNVSSKMCNYIAVGSLSISVSEGVALDKANQQFPYVQITLTGSDLEWSASAATYLQKYFPMLIISSPEAEVRLQGWGDYCNLYANTMEASNVFKPGSSENSMGDWCTSGEAVVIGAYTTDLRYFKKEYTNPVFLDKNPNEVIGRYASFSSYGHDFSEARRAYPDVSAPGVCIYGADNSFDSGAKLVTSEYTNQFKDQTEPRQYPYATHSGTSMSTPAAAGIIALWMQAAKDKGKRLTNKDIKEIIAATSDTDDFTKEAPLRYGAGKINAYKGLLYVLGLSTGIDNLSQHQPAGVRFRLTDGKLYADGADDGTPVSLYNLQGVRVGQTTVQGGAISLDGLTQGVYAVQLGKLGSTLIRL